jgi:predicted DNA-binding transcriptional regulator AlpA
MNDEPEPSTRAPAPMNPAPEAGPEVPATAPQGVYDALAKLPDKALVTETALAALLHMGKRTIRRMVSRHELPPPVRFAGHSTWLAGGILEHFQARAERAARDAERLQRKSQEFA